MSRIEDHIEQTPEGIWVIKGDHRLEHDRGLIAFAQNHILPGSVVIDVGAFIGDHTIAYVETAGPDGIVCAYEPNPVAYVCLKKNCPDAICFQYAVGEKIGHDRWHREEGNIGASRMAIDGELQVNCTTLDRDFDQILSPLGWHKVSLIKIDAEGCEPEVLNGAKTLIDRYRPAIILQMNEALLNLRGYSRANILRFMSEQSYRIEFITPQHDWSSKTPSDVLLMPDG